MKGRNRDYEREMGREERQGVSKKKDHRKM